MIIDYTENLHRYGIIAEDIDSLLVKSKRMPLNEIQYISNGYYSIQEGTSSHFTKKNFEKHKDYLDIHLILDGLEIVSWNILENSKVYTEYDVEDDIQFFESQDKHFYKVDKKMFYVAYPWDLHKPAIHIDNQYSYKKLVLKVKVK